MSARQLTRRSVQALTDLHRDWIARSAWTLLVLRICEGSAAWLLSATIHGLWPASRQPPAAVSLAVWLLYLAANVLFYRQYRRGQFSARAIGWDLVINFGTILYFAICTGGLRSPALLLCFAKVATYGLLFGAALGTIGAVLMVVALVALLAFGSWLPPLSAPLPAAEAEVAFLLVFAAALASAGWLFHQIAWLERRDRSRAEQAHRATQRAQAAAEVTAALLSVSEAVSRLTNVHEVLEQVVDVASRVLAVDRCAVLLWEEERQEFRGAAVSGGRTPERDAFLQLRLQAQDAPDLQWVQRLGHCAVLGPLASQQISGGLSPQVLVAPMVSAGRFYGVIEFIRRQGQPFLQEELRLADGIAAQAAVALERARLVEQSYRLLRAIQSADEAVLIVDANARVLFANRAFHQLFGYSWEELQSRPVANLAEPPPGGWEAIRYNILREQRWRGELTARARDGSTFPISLHLSPILGPEGTLEGVVAIVADVRAEKETQERLARADRIAAAGQLAAGLAHEVNNALTVILGQAETATASSDPHELRSALVHIREQGQRMALLVEELLGFARPRPPELRPLDLASLVDTTVRLMEPELTRAGIHVRCECVGDDWTVRGDASQLQQVLVNLLKNAGEALAGSSHGTITVRCRRNGPFVLAEVEDNGPGIAPTDVARIFDPFFTTKPTGTGLGLSVSYAIAQAHGGELNVRSVVGSGTTFVLQLPAHAVDTEASVRIAQPHVLLVDDDDAIAATFQRMLEREGVTVSRAATGREALAMAERDDFDAVLLDVRLPDLSGTEVFEHLCHLRPELARRVAFVTGGLWRSSSFTAERLPPQPTLAKPCTSVELRAVLERLRSLRAAA